VIGVLVFAALQFFNPSHANPQVEPGHDLMATNPPPRAIATILRNSCYDCHSSETRWPWYSRVAPVSWYIASDVKAGRGGMNFSDWPHDDAKRARKRWRHVADDVRNGEMPMASYMRLHPDARLTRAQRDELVKWAEQQAGD